MSEDVNPAPHPLVLPPRTETSAGEPRRLGIEIELSGLSMEAVGRAVARVVGGEVEHHTAYEQTVHAAVGDFGIEVDFGFLKRRGREGAHNPFDRMTEALAASWAEMVLPIEVCGPPLPFEQVGLVDSIGDALAAAGARGTRDSLLYAFGVHFNPEVVSTETGSILRHLQAFLVLGDWLVHALDVDMSRRVTSFVDPFPPAYLEHVLREEYVPDRDTLIDDYLLHNPTRNRALDVLPLFSHLDPERVSRHVRDDLVKARPTWHYRLCDSRVGEEGWHPTSDWWSWVLVERLADDGALLMRLLDAYRSRGVARGGREARRAWRSEIDRLALGLRS